MRTWMFSMLLLVLAPIAHGELNVTCLSPGDSPAVTAWVGRDLNFDITWVDCRTDGIDIGLSCPCASRRPKPISCILYVAIPSDPDGTTTGTTYTACGYTDRQHPYHPQVGPWRPVQP